MSNNPRNVDLESLHELAPSGSPLATCLGDAAPAHLILANAARGFLGCERPDLARALADIALSDQDKNADMHSVVADILDREGDWQSSLARLRHAYALAPLAPQVRLNLAMALLRLGEYREGFALYEARIEKPAWSGFATPESRAALRHLLLRPDQPVEGRRIVVLAEQGLGDSIMFARYIPMLAKRGARVAVACQSTLRPFFARMAGIETVLSPPADQPLAQINLAALPFDAWIPLLSLANWFGTEAATLPAEMPYWTAEAERVARWRRQLANMGRPGVAKVGLVFQANPGGASYAVKSMTLGELMPLLALDGIDFVNLQYGQAGRDLAKAAPSTIDPFLETAPLDEYAAAIAATDLLISVDTMAAHCAGAMGHPTWLTVPHSPHWVWGLTGEATHWYPSMKLVRQTKRRNWSDVVATLTTQLRENFALSGSAAKMTDPLAPSAQAAEIALPSATRAQQLADDRQAARELPAIAQALTGYNRSDLARAVVSLVTRLENAGESGHDAIADCLEQDGDWEAALAHRRRAASGGEDPFRFKLACAQLLHGDFERGFCGYESRRALPLWREQALPSANSLAVLEARSLKPGDPLKGRHIVVFTEQGLGDTFFAARFLPTLAERGARITLVCRSPMRPFFGRLPFFDAILSPPENEPASKIDLKRLAFDAVCPLLSLPFVLRIADAAPKPPYLSVDPAQTEAWRARYRREGRADCRKIGLVWHANPSNRLLANRSMRTQDLAPLAHLDHIDWVNLQHGAIGRELGDVLPKAIDATQGPLPLDEFAAALAATDLVVSVDTMAAHCAGALAHPVCVALPAAPAWYWGLRGGECGWYPAARLFRGDANMDWSDVISAVAAELAALSLTEPPKAVSKHFATRS